METMKIIYVVTSGSYSDYHIDAIFSTNELAQKFIDTFKGVEDYSYNEMDIEEWELNPNEIHLNAGRKPFFVRIDREGNISDIEKKGSSYGFRDDIPVAQISFTFDEKNMNVMCYADDEAHAIKIAGEKRSQVLAQNIWGNKLYNGANPPK